MPGEPIGYNLKMGMKCIGVKRIIKREREREREREQTVGQTDKRKSTWQIGL